MSRQTRRLFAILGLVALAPTIAGCGGGSNGFATPEACFAAMQTAAKNKDIPALCDCITEESQSALAGGLVMMGSMLKMMSGMAAMGGPEAKAEAEKTLGAVGAVLEKHGVTEEALKNATPDPHTMGDSKAILKLADMVKDKKAFISDMFAAMQQAGQGDKFSDQMDEQVAGQLKDVKIDGDRATAVVVTDTGESPIEFRRSNGSGWKLHINLDEMAARGEAPTENSAAG
jgi:hypothetical protein